MDSYFILTVSLCTSHYRKLSLKDSVYIFVFHLYVFVYVWFMHLYVYVCVHVDAEIDIRHLRWSLSNLFFKTRSSEAHRCDEMGLKRRGPAPPPCCPCSASAGATDIAGCRLW